MIAPKAETPTLNTNQLLLEAFDKRWKKYRAELKRCQTEFSNEAVHDVRIAFKGFRYMVEIIHPLLDGFPEMNLEHMNDYQSLMGEIQDVEVIMQTLADFPSSASSFDLKSVRGYYENRHAEATSAYMEKMNQLDEFWRAAPDQPFPWEQTT